MHCDRIRSKMADMSGPRRWQIWALSFLCWTVYAALDSAGSFALIVASGGKPVLGRVVAWNFAYAYLWVLFTPFIYEFARRFEFRSRDWMKPLVLHVPFVVVITAVDSWFFIRWNMLLGWADLSRPFRERFLDLGLENLPRCIATLGLAHAFVFYFRLREQQTHATRLEARLVQAQLEILRSQLEPHFLFNTLNSIATLTQQNPRGAERMTIQLASLLRVSLECAGTQEVPLQRELQFLQDYVDIQRTRFRDRLTINVSVDPQLLTATVPSLILQPLVENAIRHGVAKSARPGVVEIRAARESESLRIEIADNGPGNGESSSEGRERYGLRNTQARLRQLYGDRQSFHFEDVPTGGCRVVLKIPLRSNHAARSD